MLLVSFNKVLMAIISFKNMAFGAARIGWHSGFALLFCPKIGIHSQSTVGKLWTEA